MIYIKSLFDPQLADANHQLLKTFAKGVWCERSRKRCQDCRHANLFQYIILNFRKWFEYGLKAQKLLAPGSRVAFSERIWRLWERNRKSWERKRETWERNWATWERRILFKGHFCALRRGTIVPQVGILSVSVFFMNYANTLHPSSIPRNPLCLSGFQGLNGTISPFIPLHIFSFFLQIWR